MYLTCFNNNLEPMYKKFFSESFNFYNTVHFNCSKGFIKFLYCGHYYIIKQCCFTRIANLSVRRNKECL